ncbi:unnamed protein product [Echinostoma caproni]|uniref:Protein kinase domain-containing protein n=1 Tax=Echinostoma caproni TaxID=27848 RepID=A0A3P8KY91_9TREM|nr:unnamed protein product [Echinostoma caproni]
MHKLPDVRYELAHCLCWIARAADGAHYLHNCCQPAIVHGDLKPANMLLFNAGLNLKLTDFGSARSLDSGESRRPGTLIYTAPEISCVREGMALEYTEKSDVYSLAISLWEVLARQRPYANSTRRCKFSIFWDLYRRRPTPLRECPPLLSKLLEQGWNEDPLKRPTMCQISAVLDGIVDLIPQLKHSLQPLNIPSELPQDDDDLSMGNKSDVDNGNSAFVHEPSPSACTTIDQPGDLPISDLRSDEQLEPMPIECLNLNSSDEARPKRPGKTDEPLSILCNWDGE